VNKLWLIPITGAVKEIPASEYGKLRYGCPDLKWMRERLDKEPDIKEIDMIEHVNVLFQNKHCHMFVDEMGLLVAQPFNVRASRIYWNATLARSVNKDLVYNDLMQDATYDRNHTLAQLNLHPIMGPALLWTGDME
jgi:hypothetical protein